MRYPVKTVVIIVSIFSLHNLSATIVKIVNNAPYPIVAHFGRGESRSEAILRAYTAISTAKLTEIGRKSGSYLLEPKKSIKHNTGLHLDRKTIAFSKPDGKKLYVVTPDFSGIKLYATIIVNSLSDIRRGKNKKPLKIKVVERSK